MSERIHVLAQQLLGKPSVEACDLQEIRDLAHRYPYFAPAQFLLLEKLKQENSPDYQSQLQKAVLYYHNPLEFEYFINSERFYTNEEAASFEPQAADIGGSDIPSDMSDAETVGGDFNQTPADVHEHADINEEVSFLAQENASDEITSAEQDHSLAEERISNEVHAEEISTEQNTEPQSNDLTEPTAVNQHKTEDQHPDNEDFQPSDEVTATHEFQLHPSAESVGMPQAQPNSKSETEVLAFEPYHTVDYFASQGIKLSQEEVPKDKFGKQLKSFTEWLKTMKRLPPTEIPQAADSSSEKKVQHLAEDSVHDTDIVTEAMAEVWMKQGNRQKALETYNKLSLQNPSKRAYFAALIENLKRS